VEKEEELLKWRGSPADKVQRLINTPFSPALAVYYNVFAGTVTFAPKRSKK
jgi:hypothetical protein